MNNNEETFTNDQVLRAIRAFLEYGEESYNENKKLFDGVGHGGYFSGGGWAARVLRYHYENLQRENS